MQKPVEAKFTTREKQIVKHGIRSQSFSGEALSCTCIVMASFLVYLRATCTFVKSELCTSAASSHLLFDTKLGSVIACTKDIQASTCEGVDDER